MTARTSPLHDRHVAAGAKLADFGGWSMPIEYAGGGVLSEHTAVRTGVGLFDVSHLGTATVRGPGAAAFVDSCLTNDLGRIGPGQAQYTLCCIPDGEDRAGGVVDDLIVYLHADDDVLLVPNAANAAAVLARLADAAPAGVTVTDRHTEVAVFALQGPRSAEVLAGVGLPGQQLSYMSFAETPGAGGDEVTVCRTGYTGEHGYELLVAADRAGALWDAVLAAGEPEQIRPCGLGSRDTLRTEMGYPLHGHELSADITPNQARSGWAVGWRKPAFWGRAALLAEKEAGPARTLWGLRAPGRGIPRPGMAVLDAAGERIGEVTSGTFSPTLRTGIALALLDRTAGVGDGSEVAVDVRGRPQPVQVVKPPFVESHVR
ncbi:glycine cleavage system aminomethyltransferase GcvT [Modestobacter sp. I12A-02628]|uniref:Aminomethyltransferase n=1 Tax=Goekera deserti TaxID=2497753 RepID=A0A7K3WB11_9ACTN|nr:glycine cleavage system aminomethyltransferase GcvT [Goekera deserti]MPQ97637.1 glycine cleavage system aminomethyltransferase GcvT [Goekera deserti]NDI47758.1 glycine cleavage system aminomethyltransferase GcvT [Goekera deserti]NEL53506.1 glycine cleavage system aminomethyltransferase GcvT [Goekera deserti]